MNRGMGHNKDGRQTIDLEGWVDIGCADLALAEYNRYLVANKLFTTAYVLAEEAIKKTPLGQALASWIPRGALPKVGKKDWRQHSGGQDGFYEVEEVIVVGDLTDLLGDVV